MQDLRPPSHCSSGNHRRSSNNDHAQVVIVTPSKEQAAKRRAYRRVALNKSRAKKEHCVVAFTAIDDGNAQRLCEKEQASYFDHGGSGSSELSGDKVGQDHEVHHGDDDPIDKKAARAIRNREAAMKSRIEAKLKMNKLEHENQSLCVKLRALTDENQVLTNQLRTVLQHALGISVDESQDVKQVFQTLLRMSSVGNVN